MRGKTLIFSMLAISILACSTSPAVSTDGIETPADSVEDQSIASDVVLLPDRMAADETRSDELPDVNPVETIEDTVGCAPGEGCFMDKCNENSDCLSGWCVEHIGEGVCTQNCTEECPAGWTCKMLGSTGVDAIFICMSDYANLCKPCNEDADCKSVGGSEDVCLNYNMEGGFCGGLCETSEDCPWGFSCLASQTVDDIDVTQCLADAGICPCSSKSIALSLWTTCIQNNDIGTCNGKRICTSEGLSDCDAQTPSDENCNGLDDDCDGDTDEPTAVDGDFINLCNDDNECTEDACKGTDGCEYVQLNEGECKDGDSCTVGDHCINGTCTGNPIQCNDDNPCTDDACDGLGGCHFVSNEAYCDDDNPCTVGDRCAEGECTGTSVPCDCQTHTDCTALEDGDLCNGTLLCETETLPYKCKVDPGSIVTCLQPDGPGAECLQSACIPETGACEDIPANTGFICDDGDACTAPDVCLEGLCTSGAPLNCNDGNLCTDDTCTPETGCANTPNNASCDDGLLCTVGDTCVDGQCLGGINALACDDNNPCTDDVCDPNTGCVHTANQAACNDQNLCTNGDICADGVCSFSAPEVCTDDNACTTDSCDPAVGCVFALNTAPCDDENTCTTGDHCHLGECISSSELLCNDNNLCTDDSCNFQNGCVFQPNADGCDDANPCTTGDHCANGWCTPGQWTLCNDANPCTDDVCDPGEGGCTYTANNLPCIDDDFCTVNDKCANSVCESGNMISCDDSNPCTDDVCVQQQGCVYSQNNASCDDFDACTDGDTCDNGACVAGPTLACDDQNICTDDTCDPLQGCLFTSNNEPCTDNNACTVNDTCQNDSCIPGPAPDCDDQNTCTDDSCDQIAGCVNAPNNLACPGGTCSGGTCVPDSDCIEYSTGNAAYWTERSLGYRDVCIGGGATAYSYDDDQKQYKNGIQVLLPNLSGQQNGQTTAADSFYGFSGGTPADGNYQWDGLPNPDVAQPSTWDTTRMFISPVSGSEFDFCKALNWNSGNCGSTSIDGPAETLAYPDASPKSGTYNLASGSEQINAGVLVGSIASWISQQQLDATAHPSYCVVTYGKGWRLPTDIEMGHRTNAAGWNAGIDSSYDTQNAGNYHLWTSARYGNSAGTRFILWPTGTPQNAYWDGNGVTAGNQRVRCVFPPRDSCPGGNCEDDPAKLYFSDVQHGTITRTDLDGSNSETIISGIDADALALDTSAGKIYWVDSDSAIKRANLDGTLVETVLNNLPSPYGIALDVAGGKMYWTNQSGNPKIQRADFDGGNMVTLVNGSGCCTAGIALDVAGSRMYWVDGYYNGNIVRANLDGSNSQNIATTTGIPTGIALDTGAGKVYWSEYGNGNDDFIRRANLDGSNVEALLSHASGLETPQHIALDVDNGKMYFADLHNHKIFTANLNGSGLTTLIDGLGYPRGIALDL